MSIAPSSFSPLRQHFDGLVMKWRRLISSARDSYRPELHYMRGPGPKWRAKYQSHAEAGSM
jgi:hypothetical protein